MDKKKFEELMMRAEKGSTPSLIELGHSYLTGMDYDGNEFPQDYSEAMRWLEAAHEKEAFTATTLLGTMYEKGKSTPVNLPKAIELYELAVKRGAYLPCVFLARIYARESGVDNLIQNAVKWYQKVLSFEGEVDDEGEMEEARKYLHLNFNS